MNHRYRALGRFLSPVLGVLLSFAAGFAVAAESTKLRIAVVANSTSGTPTFVGPPLRLVDDPEFREALRQRNVELEWVPVTTAAVATLTNEAFTNKRIDFAFYGDLPSVILNASGIRTRLVVPGNLGTNTYLAVPVGSSATTLRDLKGKRIALHRGRPWEVSFAKLLESNGLRFQDFRIVNLNPQASAAALASGSVDAFFTLDDAYVLEEKGIAKVIWSSHEAPHDWKMRAELWGSEEFIQRNPELTQLLATATVRAMHWISRDENRDEYIRQQARFGLPETVIRRDADANQVTWKDYWAPLFTASLKKHYQQVVEHAYQNKLIRKPVDASALFASPDFVNNALTELGLRQYWNTALAWQH